MQSRFYLLDFVLLLFHLSHYTFHFVADKEGENMTESLIAEGLVDVRRMGLKKDELVKCFYFFGVGVVTNGIHSFS